MTEPQHTTAVADRAYDPSAWGPRVTVAVGALAAMAIAVYMALFQWGLIDGVWDPVFGTSDEVLDSDLARQMYRWMVIPDAALGAFAYLGDVVLALAGSSRRWKCRPWLVILFGIDVILLGVVSAVLIAMQGTVVGDWCFLCLVTGAISLALIYFAYGEVWSSLAYLRAVWDRTRDRRVLWDTLRGRPTDEAVAVADEIERRACGRG